jgi:hypothetical protein
VVDKMDKSTFNLDNIQHEKLRKKIDVPFSEAHAKLHADLKAEIITREKHDRLHNILWKVYDVQFEEENKKQPSEDIIPEEDYNIKDGEKKADKAARLLAVESPTDIEEIVGRLEDKAADTVTLKATLFSKSLIHTIDIGK